MSKLWIGIGAAAVTLGAVGATAWQARAQLGGGREVRSAESAAGRPSPQRAPTGSGGEPTADRDAPSGPGGPAWESNDGPAPDRGPSAAGREFTFLPARSPAALADTLLNAESDIRAAADAVLAPLGVPAVQRLGLVRSWMALLEPLIRGEEESFVAAAIKLGAALGATASAVAPADPPAPDAPPPPAPDASIRGLYTRLHGLLGGATISAAGPEFAVLGQNAMHRVPRLPNLVAMGGSAGVQARATTPMMVAAEVEETEAGRIEHRSVLMPLHELFPAAAAAAGEGASVAEVFTACRLPGRDGAAADAGLTTYMVWNGAAAQWQPVALRIELVSDESKDRLRQVMQAAQGAPH